jgi:outer membrane protein OmpA-like peptidoglycan-associated protein
MSLRPGGRPRQAVANFAMNMYHARRIATGRRIALVMGVRYHATSNNKFMKRVDCMLRDTGRLFSPLLFLVVAAVPIQASAAGKDCPYIGMLDSFEAPDDPQAIAYETREFKDQKQTIKKTGKVCKQIYRLKSGLPKMSGLEIMSNYEQSIPAAGARITNPGRGGDDEIYATMTKDGVENWFYVYESNGDTVTVTEVQVMPFKRTLLASGGTDYRLLGHMPGAKPRAPVITNFDEVEFKTQDKPVKVRGYHYKMIYDASGTKPVTSGLEIQENYRAALNDLGASIAFADSDGETVARLDDNGKVVWVDILTNAATTINVVEEKPLALSIRPPQADDMKTALDRDGHIALYVNFDFNKATLKPDAQPVIAQVVALMKANSGLKLSIQGHTDSIGPHDVNVKLSQDRAATVVAALKAQSIDGARLSSAGFGPDKPISPNDTEDGRSKNRRVELVKN